MLTSNLVIALLHELMHALDYVPCAISLIYYTFEGASNLFLASVCGEAATAMGIVAYRSKAFIDLVDECGHRIAAFDQVLKTGELHL
jgi:hypothetical protein